MSIGFDLSEFGKKLRLTRESLGFSRKYTHDKTGITENTLYLIENGKTVPQLVTLEILANFYNEDLLHIFENYKYKNELYFYIRRIEDAVLSTDKVKAEKLLCDLESDDLLRKLVYFDREQYFYLVKFLKSLILSFGSLDEKKHAISNLEKMLNITNDYSVYSSTEKHNFSTMHIKTIVLLGIIQYEVNNINNSLLLLEFSLNYLLLNENPSHEEQKLVMKVYSNILYCLHLKGKNEDVIKYSNAAVGYCKMNELMFLLYFIYFRKGVAEFLLGRSAYISSFQNGIALLLIKGDEELLENFIKITYEKYGIDLNCKLWIYYWLF